ncbi:hypothetical protein TNCV_86641 [Trichonephila clavipes]|nr:hypothetical protein TNCV_86641 [Trichonephila clavipes]
MKRYDQKVYKLPPPYPGSCTCRDKQTTFRTTARAFLKRNRVFITPVIRPPVLIARPFTALATPQPIPDPPVQIPVFQPPVQISPVPTTPPVQIPDPLPVPTLCSSFTRSTTWADPSTRSTTFGRDFGVVWTILQ